jgi:hypothetical protein
MGFVPEQVKLDTRYILQCMAVTPAVAVWIPLHVRTSKKEATLLAEFGDIWWGLLGIISIVVAPLTIVITVVICRLSFCPFGWAIFGVVTRTR